MIYDNTVLFPKALAAKLGESVDLATITISGSAFKDFVALYKKFARAVGLGVLALKWSVEDGDLVFATVSGTRKHKVTASEEAGRYWFARIRTSESSRWVARSYGELFSSSIEAIYEYDLDVRSAGCNNILSAPASALVGYGGIAVSGFDDKAKHVAAYESIAVAVRNNGQKKVESLVRDLDKAVDVIRGRARTCAIADNKRIIWNK
jgi:hypothetical protein